MPPLEYKFVELSTVTEDSLERTVNEWVGRGWQLDGIRFVTSDASRRPSMAFVSFVRPTAGQPDVAVADAGIRTGAGRPTLRSLAEIAAHAERAGGELPPKSRAARSTDPTARLGMEPYIELDLDSPAVPPAKRGGGRAGQRRKTRR